MNTENEEAAQWSLYLICTAQASLYTGVTTDVQRRFAEHENRDNKNKGAKALRGKGPLKLVFKIVVGNRSDALKLEYKVKQLSRTDKQRLISRTSKLEELITWLQEK
jgi:putative endonuclease